MWKIGSRHREALPDGGCLERAQDPVIRSTSQQFVRRPELAHQARGAVCVGCQQQVPDLVSDGSTEQRGMVDIEMTGKVEDAIDVDRGQHAGAFPRVNQGIAEATRVTACTLGCAHQSHQPLGRSGRHVALGRSAHFQTTSTDAAANVASATWSAARSTSEVTSGDL